MASSFLFSTSVEICYFHTVQNKWNCDLEVATYVAVGTFDSSITFLAGTVFLSLGFGRGEMGTQRCG